MARDLCAETEVTNFHSLRVGKEHVLRLDVAMYDVVLMLQVKEQIFQKSKNVSALSKYMLQVHKWMCVCERGGSEGRREQEKE